MIMIQTKIAPYGAWKSPITTDLIIAGTIGLGAVCLDGEDIYWLEGRPSEGGRNVIVKKSKDGREKDITPPLFNVRTRVHEYGGGSFLVVAGTIYFVNFTDLRIYCQIEEKEPQALTANTGMRYADFVLDALRNRLICVAEMHNNDENNEDSAVDNYLVSIDLNSGAVTTLVSGSDFYTSPRISNDGKHLAYISWNHPNLPWDGTQLWLAEINADGTLGDSKCVAGSARESIHEPKWSPDNYLYFTSDRSNWWNIYRYNLTTKHTESICSKDAEFAYPHWVFGLSNYDFISDSELICSYTQKGRWYLGKLTVNLKSSIGSADSRQELTTLDLPYTDISSVCIQEDKLVFLGSSPQQSTAVVLFDLITEKTQILKSSSSLEINSGYLSLPKQIEFPTSNGLTAYAWYYPPQNKDYSAPEGELPPLLVKSHGGPTAAASASLNLKVQYWTSRGFGYLDVNYGGSTGYGREYRQRLQENWGIVDVEDCANGAKYLVELGLVDGDKLAISGGSAGGFTTLAALTFKDVFKAGASYYGVSDLEALAMDTHKFEAHYLDGLIGKYPEEKEIYQARSPIHHTDKLACPTIFFQGLEDKVVPPNQAEMMVKVLQEKGLPVAYVPFEGEQHGFRQAQNIKRALDGEFYFYSRIFGFSPAETIEPISIVNLD
jgi:dipeptidyl aminopeptidase/acylaminoacyl peptidase